MAGEAGISGMGSSVSGLVGLHHVRPAIEGCVCDSRSFVMCSHLEASVCELSGSLNSRSHPDNATDHNREQKLTGC